MRRRIAVFLLAAAAAVPAAAQAPEPGVAIETAAFDDGRVRVAFELSGVLDDETLELIHSGIPVRFRHRVELQGGRKYLLSPRKTYARVIVETRVAYDALTGRYTLSRTTELKKPNRKKAPDPAVVESVSSDTASMLRWMTRVDDVALYDPEGPLPAEAVRVAVESAIGRSYVLWVIPTRDSVEATAPVRR